MDPHQPFKKIGSRRLNKNIGQSYFGGMKRISWR
jgi:hypothetical protein